MYWSDTERQAISRRRCVPGLGCDPRSGTEDLVTDQVGTVDGLAVDPLSQVLYWTDAERRRIEAMKLPDGPRAVLVWDELDRPRAIALHYESGYNYVVIIQE